MYLVFYMLSSNAIIPLSPKFAKQLQIISDLK